MGRLPKQQVNAEINRIRRILEDDITKTDPEIIQQLNINQRTYYRYKQRIIQQDTETWLEVAKEPLESAALKVKKSLDYATKIAKDVAEHSADQRARLEAAKKVVECQVMFYRMLEKGPTSKGIVIPQVQVKEDSTNSSRMESMAANKLPT